MISASPRVFAISLILLAYPAILPAQESSQPLVFRSSVNMVSIAAVVRDQHGRIVPTLSAKDFDIIADGRVKAAVDVRSEANAPANVALLIDGSGSMRLGDAQATAARISDALLRSLDEKKDEAALFSFDTRLLTLQPFTHDFDAIRVAARNVDAWGSTSLWDAIGGVAGRVQKGANRRAVIVFTDGADTASEYTPEQIAAIASTLDVPVYAFAIGTPGGEPGIEPAPPLAILARATGGEYFIATDASSLATSINRLLEELRYQHVIAFEGDTTGGWRSVEIRMHKRGLKVRARGGYLAETGE